MALSPKSTEGPPEESYPCTMPKLGPTVPSNDELNSDDIATHLSAALCSALDPAGVKERGRKCHGLQGLALQVSWSEHHVQKRNQSDDVSKSDDSDGAHSLASLPFCQDSGVKRKGRKKGHGSPEELVSWELWATWRAQKKDEDTSTVPNVVVTWLYQHEKN